MKNNVYRVYGDIHSGNCYKIKLLMHLLDIGHEWIHVDIMQGESRTPEFLAMNPNGKVPVVRLPDSRYLFESNAILNYLAEGTDYLPADRYERAQVLQWQFFEQYSHEPFIATSRYIIRYLGRPPEQEQRLREKSAPGYRALDVMERHLSSRPFFVADRYTIADIALYAYTHVAHEGGFDLSKYIAVKDWLDRVAAQPGYVGMDG
ncbi:MAG TPA: glutathione S-transferase family protein [Gammaproteobacteria bacterium]